MLERIEYLEIQYARIQKEHKAWEINFNKNTS